MTSSLTSSDFGSSNFASLTSSLTSSDFRSTDFVSSTSSCLLRRNFNKRWNNNQPFSILFGPKIIRTITEIKNIPGEFKPKKFITLDILNVL